MKNKIYKLFTIALFASAVSITGCKKTLEIQPKDQVDAGFAVSSKDGIDATIISMYATLKIENLYGNRLIGLGEALADNGQATNRSGRYVNEAANVRGTHYSHWSNSYNVINRINLVLEVVPTATFLSDVQKDAYVGELKFLRALYYFDLVKAYAYIPGAIVDAQNRGGVPLVLKSTQTIADALANQSPRATIDEVYTQIYADLDDATTKIPTTTVSIFRATRAGAQGLYSRVALYRKDYAKVITLASAAITTAAKPLLTTANYVAGFRQPSNPESLFEVAFAAPSESLGVNVSLQTLFTSLRTPGDRAQVAGFGDLVPTNSLLAALGITVTGNSTAAAAITTRTADVRNQLYELSATARGPAYVECTKFLGRSSSVNLDNVPVIRVSELYLNRAEAYANTGSDVLALADLNSIRTNRGLTAFAGTGTALLTEILNQRRIELAFEGHRFLDLKRRGQDVLKQNGSTFAFTNPVLLPGIPQADVDASQGKLLQNFSY